MKTNKDTPPQVENLTEVPFTKTIPDVSWYRHQSWKPGEYKRFRHMHTMSQNITGFEFFNDKKDLEELEREGKLDSAYYAK